LGEIKVCKVGNVAGTFTVTATDLSGNPIAGEPGETVGFGTCKIVAVNTDFSGVVLVTVTETPSSALQSVAADEIVGPAPGTATPFSGTITATGATHLRFSGEHGYVLTFTNNVTQPNTPSIATLLVPLGPVAIGAAVHDTATLTGATATAGGTVTYHAYAGANTCSGLDLLNSTVTVTNGVVPSSASTSFAVAGTYSFQATYSGDANNTGPVSSVCSTEQLVVSPPPPPGISHGCTPGFWKTHAGNPPWGSYTPGQLVQTVFTIPSGIPAQTTFQNETLLDALGGGGGSGLNGKTTILLRAATAALLNADNGNPAYPITTAQVISQSNAALASLNQRTITDLATQLDNLNNQFDVR